MTSPAQGDFGVWRPTELVVSGRGRGLRWRGGIEVLREDKLGGIAVWLGFTVRLRARSMAGGRVRLRRAGAAARRFPVRSVSGLLVPRSGVFELLSLPLKVFDLPNSPADVRGQA